MVPLFFWVITFDQSGMGAPASSYDTTGIAIEILRPRKPSHCVKVGIHLAGNVDRSEHLNFKLQIYMGSVSRSRKPSDIILRFDFYLKYRRPKNTYVIKVFSSFKK
jgi:hypothetical protein